MIVECLCGWSHGTPPFTCLKCRVTMPRGFENPRKPIVDPDVQHVATYHRMVGGGRTMGGERIGRHGHHKNAD